MSELEEAVKDLETQLGQQEEETKAVIAKWQTTCTALEEQNQNFKSQLQASTENGEALEVQLQEARNGLEEAEKKSKEDEEVLANWQGELRGFVRTGDDGLNLDFNSTLLVLVSQIVCQSSRQQSVSCKLS